MHVVESLTNAVTAPMNAFFGMAKVKSDYLQTGLSSSSGKHTILQTSVLDGERLVTCAGKTTQPSGEALSDPGVTLAQQVLGLVSDLKLLISGGPGGKPDWNNIRGSVRTLHANLRLPKHWRTHSEQEERWLVRRSELGKNEGSPRQNQAHLVRTLTHHGTSCSYHEEGQRGGKDHRESRR